MLDSIYTVSSYIRVKVAPCLSLKRRAKSGSKAPAKVTFVAGWEGLTSAEILLYNLLNLWINSITIFEFIFFKDPNSVR
jgi:hypothetical protein